jgi:hypothetical protein
MIVHGWSSDGTVARPISFAAMTRPWPAMITPPESIRIGVVPRNSETLVTICATCAGEWVRAFLRMESALYRTLLDRRGDDWIHENPSFDPPEFRGPENV